MQVYFVLRKELLQAGTLELDTLFSVLSTLDYMYYIPRHIPVAVSYYVAVLIGWPLVRQIYPLLCKNKMSDIGHVNGTQDKNNYMYMKF